MRTIHSRTSTITSRTSPSARLQRVLRRFTSSGLLFLLTAVPLQRAVADATPQVLPFSQDWSNTGLITVDDDWSVVPGFIGYRGDGLTGGTGVDPQTIVGEGAPVDVNANQIAPNTFTTGGVTEFHIANPGIALAGSGTAKAPFLLLNLNLTGQKHIVVRYNLRDIDGSSDNAAQPVALQYRVGNSGNFINLPSAFVADASTGPNLSTAVTPVSITLPVAVEEQPLVQLRWITTDASGSDEWVAIDDIEIGAAPSVVTQPAGNPTDQCGGSVSLGVSATGSTPLSYQWRRNGIALSNGPRISGADTAALTINPASLADDGGYDVVITNSFGSITSAATAVDIVDTIAPNVVLCAPNDALTVMGCLAPIPDLRALVLALDGCDASPVVSQSPLQGTMVGTGAHVVTLTVTDSSGNASSCNTTITILDGRPAPSVVYVDDGYVGQSGCASVNFPYTGAGTHEIGYDAFPTLQAAINAVASGGVVQVAGGTYTENVVINKPLELAGGFGGESLLRPAISDPNCGGSGGASLCAGASVLILVQASDVTIHNLTLDGDNPSLTSGVVVGGADIDARNGIITDHTSGVYQNLVVHDVLVRNVFLRGIYASTGGSFNIFSNAVHNVSGSPNGSIAIFNFGGSGVFKGNLVSNCLDGVVCNWSTGTQFLTNTVLASASGIHTDNNGGAGGVADLLQGNVVRDGTAGSYGVWVFAPFVEPTVRGNCVSNVAVGLTAAGRNGVLPITTLFASNVVDGAQLAGGAGVYLTTSRFGFGDTDVNALLLGNVITNCETGLYLETTAVPPGLALTATLHRNQITGHSAFALTNTGPGSFSINASVNYWGSTDPTAVATGISDPSVVDFTPLLNLGDSDLVEKGFQPDLSQVTIHSLGIQLGSTGRLQEGADVVVGSTVFLAPGNYSDNVVLSTHVNFDGSGSGNNPAVDSIVTAFNAAMPVFAINDIGGSGTGDRLTIKDLRITGGADGIRVTAGTGSHRFYDFDNVASVNHTGMGILLTGTADLGDVRVANSILSNNGNAGLRVESTLNSFDTLLVSGGLMDDNNVNGLSVLGTDANAGSPTGIQVVGTSFSNNGSPLSAGDGDVSFFRFNGNAGLDGVSITAAAQFPIQFRGKGTASSSTWASSGTVGLTNVMVGGTGSRPGLYIVYYSAVSAINFSNVDLTGYLPPTSPLGFASAMQVEHTGATPLNLGSLALPANPVPGGYVALAMLGTGGATATCQTIITGAHTPFAKELAVFDQQDFLGVGDVTFPNISLSCSPVPITEEATSPAGASVIFTVPGASDCDLTPVVTCAPASGSLFPLGGTTVNCLVTDSFGNSNACSFQVVVQDTTAPTITSCPTNRVLSAGIGCQTQVPNVVPEAAATDLVGPVTITQSPVAGISIGLGATIVTVTATDGAGNASTCQLTLNVLDTTPPTIGACSTNVLAIDFDGSGSETATFLTPSASDECPVSVTCVPPSGSSFALGVNPVTCTATDAGTNTAACSFVVIVCSTNTPNAYVDDDYTGLPNGTAVTWPHLAGGTTRYIGCDAFATIQEGVAVVTVGGTVHVAGGNYSGTVGINKDGITLQGSGAGLTILSTTTTNTGTGIDFIGSRSGVTLADFTVRDFNIGIHMPTGPLSNILVEDVEAVDNNTHGIWTQAFGINGITFRRVNASRNNLAGGLAGRGLWMINGVKQNVAIEDSVFNNNGLVGLDISDGNVTDCRITGNSVSGNGDSGIGVLGPQGPGATLVAFNNVTNNGRFGIEIKNPTGNGSSGGAGSVVVASNNVVRNIAATDARDYAGILVMRRSPVLPDNADQPTGVYISRNAVSGFHRKPSGSTGDGLGIVVAGEGHRVLNNTATDCDVAYQVQGGNPAINVQGTAYFDRDNAASGGALLAGNLNTGNETGFRAVGPTARAILENNSLTGDSQAGIQVTLGATVDAGDCTGSNFTGLGLGSGPAGSSAGGNTLTGYGFDNAAPWAVENLNGSAQPVVYAQNNNFGAASPADPIEAVLFDDTDTAGANSAVLFSQAGLLIVNCPASVTVECASGVPAGATTLAAFLGQGGTVSSSAASVSFVDGPLTPGPAEGTITRTYTVTDICGNTASCAQTITVDDVTPPAIVGCPANVTVFTGPGRLTCDQAATWTPPTASDNCGGVSLTSTHGPGAIFAEGTTTVTYTATDGAGLTSTCSFTVTVIDNTSPVVSCPASVVVAAGPTSCGTNLTVSVPATDNCGIASVIYQTNGVPITWPNFFPLGVTTVDVIATDIHGNAAACSFDVKVIDFTGDLAIPCWRGTPGSTYQHWAFSETPASPLPLLAPQIEFPERVNSPGSPQAGVLLGGGLPLGYASSLPGFGCRQGLWDLGSFGTMSLSVPNVTGSPGAYSYVRVQVTQFQDSLIYTQVVSVALASSATLVSQSQSVVELTSTGAWVVHKTIWRVSTCPAVETITLQAGAGSALVDQVVVDTLCLDFTFPTSFAVNADPGNCSAASVGWTTPSPDACKVLSVVCSTNGVPVTNPNTFPVGATPVACVLTDGENGAVNFGFTVTVIDNQAPTAICKPITIALDATGNVSITPGMVNDGSSDNCGPVTLVSVIPSAFTCANLGANLVTLTVQDGAGNLSTCQSAVTVTDVTPPVIALAGVSPLNHECHTPFTDPGASAVDACSGSLPVSVSGTVDVNTPGSYVLAYSAVDGSGNVATTTRTVVVVDTIAPVVVTLSATQDQGGGPVNVLNCALSNLVGAVNISVQVTEACGLSGVPAISMVNNTNADTASFISESPAGTYNFVWNVTTNTANGLWAVTVVASDSANTGFDSFILCVNKTQISGLVQMQNFAGTGTIPLHARTTIFVATEIPAPGVTNLLKTWTLLLTNTSGDTFAYTLTDVPVNTTHLSAKTAWSLRRKLPAVFDPNGQAVVDFLGASQLKGGDFTGDNAVNLADYSVLVVNWLTASPVADINGDGVVNVVDYSILASNWFISGDPQ